MFAKDTKYIYLEEESSDTPSVNLTESSSNSSNLSLTIFPLGLVFLLTKFTHLMFPSFPQEISKVISSRFDDFVLLEFYLFNLCPDVM